jgi:AraC-like DNA-binding protein
MSDDPVDAPLSAGYCEYPPPADLRDRVACTWVHRVGTARGQPQPIIPDGCVDIVAVGEMPPEIAGPATRTQLVRLLPLSMVVGIRFRPGAARAVLKCSAAELLDRNPDLRELDRRSASMLGDELSAASSIAERRGALDNWVRARGEGEGMMDAPIVLAARALFKDRHQTVDLLADELGWSARRLHRRFVAACGYGPKMLQRILRLQRAIRLARADARPVLSLAGLAREAGFADQAHMTRDFRALTGLTPSGLLAGWNGEVGRWLELE